MIQLWEALTELREITTNCDNQMQQQDTMTTTTTMQPQEMTMQPRETTTNHDNQPQPQDTMTATTMTQPREMMTQLQETTQMWQPTTTARHNDCNNHVTTTGNKDATVGNDSTTATTTLQLRETTLQPQQTANHNNHNAATQKMHPWDNATWQPTTSTKKQQLQQPWRNRRNDHWWHAMMPSPRLIVGPLFEAHLLKTCSFVVVVAIRIMTTINSNWNQQCCHHQQQQMTQRWRQHNNMYAMWQWWQQQQQRWCCRASQYVSFCYRCCCHQFLSPMLTGKDHNKKWHDCNEKEPSLLLTVFLPFWIHTHT